MKPNQRLPLWIRICAGLLVAPVVFLLVCIFGALYFAASDPARAGAISGPAGLVVIAFPVPLAFLMLLEFRAIVRKDARAAGLVAGLCLYVPILGSIGWVLSLLALLKLRTADNDFSTWGDFAILTAFLVYAGALGFAHLRWHKILTTEKPADALEPDL